MSKSRAEIDSELTRLECRLPELLRECLPDEVLEAFAAEAECLVEHAPEDQVDYVHDTICRLLRSAGLVSGASTSESYSPTRPLS